MANEESYIYVRNTVSGVTIACTVDEAAHILSHDWHKKFHIQVDKPKDEIFSQPYQVDEDGGRIPIESEDGSVNIHAPAATAEVEEDGEDN